MEMRKPGSCLLHEEIGRSCPSIPVRDEGDQVAAGGSVEPTSSGRVVRIRQLQVTVGTSGTGAQSSVCGTWM